MLASPLRGAAVRDAGLALPPGAMPRWRAGRPLKRWTYVGVYAPELMLCVGDARIGPVPQRWWAVALPGGELFERTTFGAGGVSVGGRTLRVDTSAVTVALELEEQEGVEILSPVGRSGYIWTRKQACVGVKGSVEADGRRYELDSHHGFVDESAGYHPRHTAWKWSAGIGTTEDGHQVGWNLVAGIHDDPDVSERTLWVAGEHSPLGPVTFADDLSRVDFDDGGRLAFREWSTREQSTNALLLRSRYRQPFGTFSGTLPGGLRLAEGYGVMEDHDVRW